MGRALAAASSAACRLRRRRRHRPRPGASWLGWSGRGPRPDRERPAGPAGHVDRVPDGPPRPLGGRGSRTTRVRCRHSMGQYSALVAAGVISVADGVRVVRVHGRLMQSSGQGRDGAMAAIIGLDDSRLPGSSSGRRARRLRCREPQRAGPGRRQRRTSGDRGGRGHRQGARRPKGHRPPGVGAGHSPLMAEAAEGMRAVLESVDFSDPLVRSSRTPTPARSDGGGGSERARRAPDARGRLGRGRGTHDRGGRRDLHRGRLRPRPDRPDQTDRARCRGDRRRRRRRDRRPGRTLRLAHTA